MNTDLLRQLLLKLDTDMVLLPWLLLGGQVVIHLIIIIIFIILVRTYTKKTNLIKKADKSPGRPEKTKINPNAVAQIKAQDLKEDKPIAPKARIVHTAQIEKKVDKILLENNLVTKDILDEALRHKDEYAGSIMRHLLAYGHIDENRLVQCFTTQFGFAYLPIKSYNIPPNIIELVPLDIVEKYWLIPVDKLGNVLTIIMADPLDTKAIKEVRAITGCNIQVFTGLFSDIIEALVDYYKITIKGKKPGIKTKFPFFIESETYKGLDRRQSPRYRSQIDISFDELGQYKTYKTIDISQEGILFYCEKALPVNSLITLQIDLPKELNLLSITAVVQVSRINPSENNKFHIAVRILKISKSELDAVIEYASTHPDETGPSL